MVKPADAKPEPVDETAAIATKVTDARKAAKDGRLTLTPGSHFIQSGSVYIKPGQVLIACVPSGLCEIRVPPGPGAMWEVASDKEFADAEAAVVKP